MPAKIAARRQTPPRRRPPVPRLGVLIAAVLLGGLAACGGSSDGGGGHSDGADGPATVVDLTYSTGGATKTSALDCADASSLCTLLEKLPASVFEAVPKDKACTMIYGGPEVGTIKGQVNGQEVDASFNRTNGCEIDRFAKVEPLFAEMAGN